MVVIFLGRVFFIIKLKSFLIPTKPEATLVCTVLLHFFHWGWLQVRRVWWEISQCLANSAKCLLLEHIMFLTWSTMFSIMYYPKDDLTHRNEQIILHIESYYSNIIKTLLFYLQLKNCILPFDCKLFHSNQVCVAATRSHRVNLGFSAQGSKMKFTAELFPKELFSHSLEVYIEVHEILIKCVSCSKMVKLLFLEPGD